MKNAKMKKSLIWGLLILVAIVAFGYVQSGRFSTAAYLVSVTAKDGVVIGAQDEDGCFAVTLKGADNVIWFSDRPERDAFSTGISPLVDNWLEEFGNNPPNADLQLFDEKGEDINMVLVLESAPTFGAYLHTLTFDKACPLFSSGANSNLTTDNISGKTFSKAVLFIDDFLGFKAAFKAIGGAISHETKHSTKALAKGVNFGNWEGHAAGYATGVVAMAAAVGGAAGKTDGGAEGERVGSRVGAELGVVVVQTTASIAFGADVDGSSVVDPHDFAEALKESLTETGGNLNFAHTFTENILDAQRDTLRANLLSSLNALSIEAGKDTFCGEPITENNALFNTFMYYLELKLEARIYYDLKNGMSLDEVKADVNLNMYKDIKYSLLRALWELQYYCVYDEDDLYTDFFIEMYIINYTAGIDEFPELGIDNGIGPGYRPVQSGIGYPTEATYDAALQKYYNEQEFGSTAELPPSLPDGYSVAAVLTPEIDAISAQFAKSGYPGASSYVPRDAIPSQIGDPLPSAPVDAYADASAPPFDEIMSNSEYMQSQLESVSETEVTSGITNTDTTFSAMAEASTDVLLQEANVEFEAAQQIFIDTGVSPYSLGSAYAADSAVVDETMISEIVETAVTDAVVETAIETAPK